MDEIHKNQVSKVFLYQFEPGPGQNANCNE